MLLTAFGRFQGRSLELKPGLNILYGENESGKTTIQKFLLGMLYGFKRRSLRREYTEDAARYRPWSGDDYRGSLVYSLDATGRSYRVERIFDPAREQIRLYDELTGADLTGSFAMDRRKELLFAEEQLRLSQDLFTSTAWVGQLEVGRLEAGKELVTRVANMQESGREDLSVRNALRAIDERSREIGTERAPTRPYARVIRQIAEKRAELERGRKTREQTLEWEAGLREAREAIAGLNGALAEAQRLLAWSRLQEAQARQARIQTSATQMNSASQIARELSPYAFFPAELRTGLRDCQRQMAQAEGAIERTRQRLSEVEEARAAIEEQLGDFTGLVDLGPEVATEVAAAARMGENATRRLPGLHEEAARLEEMIARIDEAIAPLSAAAEAGEEALDQIERLEHEIGVIRARQNQAQVDRLRGDAARLEKQQRRIGGSGWLILALLLFVAAAVLYLVPGAAGALLPEPFVLPVVGGLGLLGLLAVIPFALARRTAGLLGRELEEARRQMKAAEVALADDQERTRRMEKQRDQVLRGLGIISVGELRNQLIRYEQLTARRDGQHLRLESLQAEIRRAEEEVADQRERLNGILSVALGIAAAEIRPGDGSLERFQEALSQYQIYKFELDSLQREVQDLQARLAEEEGRIAVARAEQEAILAEAGVPDLESFEEACQRHEAWRKAEREAESLRSAMAGLLGGDDGSRAAAEVERLRGQVSGDPPDVIPPVELIQGEIRQLETERADWQVRASDLAARVETAQGEISDTADLERAIQALQEERQEMDRELAALELARSVITEVSTQIHREFAPRLNQAMGQVIARLTGGRYQTVKIDEDLTMRAIADGHRTVEVTALSGGTVDQFYLALRVAMLDLLTEGQERVPLFLDDPFVQYDNQRLQASMEYLAQLARSRQVVLMTCHRREVEIGRQAGAHIIELNDTAAE